MVAHSLPGKNCLTLRKQSLLLWKPLSIHHASAAAAPAVAQAPACQAIPAGVALRSFPRKRESRSPVNSPSEVNCLCEPPLKVDRVQPIRLPACVRMTELRVVRVTAMLRGSVVGSASLRSLIRPATWADLLKRDCARQEQRLRSDSAQQQLLGPAQLQQCGRFVR